jgi:hypothetical protein
MQLTGVLMRKRYQRLSARQRIPSPGTTLQCSETGSFVLEVPSGSG